MGVPGQAYTQALKRTCDDFGLAELNKMPGWHNYWAGFLKGKHLSKIPAKDHVHFIIDIFKEKGCGAFNNKLLLGNYTKVGKDATIALCKGNELVAGVTFFCPRSCGCNLQMSDRGCPSTCK